MFGAAQKTAAQDVRQRVLCLVLMRLYGFVDLCRVVFGESVFLLEALVFGSVLPEFVASYLVQVFVGFKALLVHLNHTYCYV